MQKYYIIYAAARDLVDVFCDPMEDHKKRDQLIEAVATILLSQLNKIVAVCYKH